MTSFGSVEPLDESHSVADFECGSTAQTAWLRNSALNAQRAGTARVFVVRAFADPEAGVQTGSPSGSVVGYYALTTGSVLHADAPTRLTQGTGRYDVPVVILARLGVDQNYQERGLGRALVVDAFRRVDKVAEDVGVRAMLIHAEDEHALQFYMKLAAFDASPVDPLQIILLMKDLRRAVKKT